jgi:hypothetical protein
VIGFCKLAGAEFMADPEPVTSRCYKSVTWCMTDKFLLMQSWTNGASAASAMRRASWMFVLCAAAIGFAIVQRGDAAKTSPHHRITK